MIEQEPPANIMAVLDRFMTIVGTLFRKEPQLAEWGTFRSLLIEQPLNYGRIYSQLSRIQRGAAFKEEVAPHHSSSRRDSNAYWDNYSNQYSSIQPTTKKKTSSVYRQLQEPSTKEPSRGGSNIYSINAEYSHGPQRSRSRYYDSGLKESRQQVAPSLSSSKLHREIGNQAPAYTTVGMVEYLKYEGAKLPSNKPELMRVLTSSSVVRCSIAQHLSVLSVGFFLVLLKEAYDDNSQSTVSIWEVYNRIANRAFTYTNAQDCVAFLRILNRLLHKKLAADGQRRCRSFLQQVLSDSLLLHIVERIYKEIVQQKRNSEGQESVRKVSSYSNRKDPTNKGAVCSNAAEVNRDFARVCPLRVYSVRDCNLIFQNFGDEEQSHSRLSVIKKSTQFYLILEEQSEYAASQEQLPARTIESSKSFKNLEMYARAEQPKEVASPQLLPKRVERTLSNTQSIRKDDIKKPEHYQRYDRIGSNMRVRQLQADRKTINQPPVFVTKDEAHMTGDKNVLLTQLDRLISRLNSNNSIIKGLVKEEHKYQPLKSPLVSLHDVFPLSGVWQQSRQRQGQSK